MSGMIVSMFSSSSSSRLCSSCSSSRSSSSTRRHRAHERTLTSRRVTVVVSSSSFVKTNNDSPTSTKRVLVLGGTGYVGAAVVNALTQKPSKIKSRVTSVSRRGGTSTNDVTCIPADATDPSTTRRILAEAREDGEPFDAVIHCVGMLLASDLNALASGSGSKPDEGATYDAVTRQSAVAAMDAAAELCTPSEKDGKVPFAFVSAAEAGWQENSNPLVPEWLEDYLRAKRAVERALASNDQIRSVVVRPSLVYSPDRLASLPAVGAFTVANKIGIPGIDKPVLVDDVAAALVDSVLYGEGEPDSVLRYEAIEQRASRWRERM